MDAQEIDRILSESEQALEGGGKPDLARLGFWRAVAAVKRDRGLVDRFADRIAQIDRRAFESRTPIRLPSTAGLLLLIGGLVIDIALISLATTPYAVPAIFPGPPLPFWATSPGRELVFLVGVVGLLVATHTLAHWIVGSIMGIRFTHWFSAPPLRPQPGFKTDYASYLRTPARRRAWMHASGAIVTKIVPFVVLPVAIAAGFQDWTIWVLVAIGVAQIFTDLLWSTKTSDWKRFRREMRAARA